MRAELEMIEKIEQYLNGSMSQDEASAFESQIASDPSLQAAVAAQQVLAQGVARAAIRQDVQRIGRQYHAGKRLTRWIIYGAATLVIVAATFLLVKRQFWHLDKAIMAVPGYSGTILPMLNERGTQEWATADSLIPAQGFNITGGKDTVIETEGGIVLAIPANAFLTESGKDVSGSIRLCVKEALDPFTIMNARLSTISGDRLLETGGMFFIDARFGNHILHINPSNGIYAEIPTPDPKAGMQLFSGKRLPNGTIDWINPVPLPQDLAAVDINGLDFYPPDYLHTLSHDGYPTTDKRFTDSVYYSLAAWFDKKSEVNPDATEELVDFSSGKDSVYANDWSDGLVPGTYTMGKTLFYNNCAKCHHPLRDAIGPALQGVRASWPYRQWGYDWVHNPSRMFSKGDKHALEIFAKYKPTIMTAFPNLKNEEIDAIFRFVEEFDSTCGINPAKIKAIWNTQYQNTLLATREFEQRLRLIHVSKDPTLLDLYVANLDKALYQIDSLAAARTSGKIKQGFEGFYALRNGKVRSNSKSFDKLREYYAQKTKLFTDAAAAALRKVRTDEALADAEVAQKTMSHQADNAARLQNTFQQELDLNLESAYAQLGFPRPSAPLIASSTRTAVVVTSTGWNNVDRYVLESTISRTTLDYTDPQSGKKAVIEYKPISVTIGNATSYDRLLVYLLPDKLSSFMAMNGSDGTFTEKLNSLMKYELVCIGIKAGQYSFFHLDAVQSKTYSGVQLKAMDSASLMNTMSGLRSVGQASALRNEVEYALWDIENMEQQKVRLKWQALFYDLREALFGCNTSTGRALQIK